MTWWPQTKGVARLSSQNHPQIGDSAIGGISLPDPLPPPARVAPAAEQGGLDVIAVHSRDHVQVDALGTGRLALAVVGAAPELLGVHLRDHVEHALVALGLA